MACLAMTLRDPITPTVFAYYHRLPRRQQLVYQASDSIAAITLPHQRDNLNQRVLRLHRALNTERCKAVEAEAKALILILVKSLDVPPVIVRVMSQRPQHQAYELHGLYQPREGRRRARLWVWMRTAKYRRTAKFKTFLRTLVHEFCHHLDYELLGLEDSLHTQGFFKRESSLMRQLLPKSLDSQP